MSSFIYPLAIHLLSVTYPFAIPSFIYPFSVSALATCPVSTRVMDTPYSFINNNAMELTRLMYGLTDSLWVFSFYLQFQFWRFLLAFEHVHIWCVKINIFFSTSAYIFLTLTAYLNQAISLSCWCLYSYFPFDLNGVTTSAPIGAWRCILPHPFRKLWQTASPKKSPTNRLTWRFIRKFHNH